MMLQMRILAIYINGRYYSYAFVDSHTLNGVNCLEYNMTSVYWPKDTPYETLWWHLVTVY